MGKDPSAVVLATALAFCVFCPFFARCDEIELDIKKGIESLSKILVKYQAEFDRKVNFAELQDAIDEIDKAMRGYEGSAKDKLPQIRPLNSRPLNYKNCVGPVFEWCISSTVPFNIFIDKIGDSNLSEMDRNIIRNMTVSAVELGLTENGKSLECLNHFQIRMAELDNAFQNFSIYVHNDLGPGGFYGEVKVELQKRINGSILDLSKTISTLGITELLKWNQTMQTYKEQMEFIEHLFTGLTQKIGKATEIVKDMERYLEEDKTNLFKLRGHIAGADIEKNILLSDIALLRVRFIPAIKHLTDICAEYVNWHGFDAPFYKKISSRTRRSASTFYESEPSPY
ncbi:uncharacterized protein [Drosophila bipectinata]|uniref:uncharacterized protein n=1 Tax=Drosophila bipectinata TaxID=42026 RepID=UPI001C893A9F|nr:uncharacterized protein LOC108133493 [Drosophila bipectinata]